MTYGSEIHCYFCSLLGDDYVTSASVGCVSAAGPGTCRGGWGQLASPPLFPSFSVLALSLSVFSFSFDFLYIFLSLARCEDNSLYLVVLVEFIWYPSKICVTFLQSEYAQDRTIWGTVSHFEDAGGRHTCSQSLTGAFVYPEMICRC